MGLLLVLWHDLLAGSGPGGPVTFFDAKKVTKETGP
jgi:hypothetical protein